MKKLLSFGLTLAGLAVIPLAACNSSKDGGLSSVNDVYGLGAVSSVKLFENVIGGETVQTLSSVKALAVQQDGIKGYAEKFNEYFTALDEFLGKDIVTTNSETNKDEGYPYEIKLTVTGKDITGNDVTHVMYYTEKYVGEFKDDDEVTTRYTLEGVMVVDGADYYLTGERERETEGKEVEDELKIRAYADKADKGTYVQVEQGTSVESNETEKEYTYSVYANGKLVEKTSVEFETERKGNKEEVEYELEFLNGTGRGKYTVERVTLNGDVSMRVKYNISGDKGQFIIRAKNVDGETKYEYEFSDGTKKIF